MQSLTKYELEKTWGQRNFVLSVCALVLINLFLLWYANLPDESTAPLSAYKKFAGDINHMTEQEKASYLNSLKETLDGINFVQDVLIARKVSGEMGETLAAQLLESRPGAFEKYHPLYQDGAYLHYTGSFYQEKSLVDEWYAEWLKVDGYGTYLRSVQENKEILQGIGIFANQEQDSFSARNITKSAKAYQGLSDAGIRWMPAKSLVLALKSLWTDLLLLLAAFLFVGSIIFEEKKKQLFYVTRSTKRGIFHSVYAKLKALFLHCIAVTLALYGSNLAFFGLAAGLPHMNAPLQSLAPYMESPLPITIGQFLFLSLSTKALALFGVSAILTALCIQADSIVLPYGLMGALCTASWLLYLLFPAGTKFSALKYCNLAGIMRTQELYGTYLNFNLAGYPVSRTLTAWILILLLCAAGISLSILWFERGQRLCLRSRKIVLRFPYKPHVGVLRHELYKIMITNKALYILLAFLFLMGYSQLTEHHNLSVWEQYYQEFMLQLEGSLQPEKEAMILAENGRFQKAFEEIEKIDQLIFEGKLTEAAGEDLKSKWYAVTAFYPSFQRIWTQYQRILEQGGNFIYDSGYLYLCGVYSGSSPFLRNLLLLSICFGFAFGNCVAMEYKKGAHRLLDASFRGRTAVHLRKAFLCAAAAASMCLILFLCRIVNIASVFPMGGMTFSIQSIPCFADFPLPICVALFLLLFALSQAASLILVVWGVLLVSGWQKDYVQSLFACMLLFALPPTLKLLGFGPAAWFSLYPFYAWPEIVFTWGH